MTDSLELFLRELHLPTFLSQAQPVAIEAEPDIPHVSDVTN